MKRERLCGVAGIAFGAASLVLGPATPACAQPAPPPAEPAPAPSPEQEEEATRLFDRGRKAANAGQWPEARELFLRAWRIKPHWLIAAALGRTELRSGQFRDAAEHLSSSLREAEGSLTAVERKEIEDTLAKARTKVGALSITVDPPGAEVVVNGQLVGKTPLPGMVFVDPGLVFVDARLPGYAPVRETRTTVAGKEEGIRVVLRPLSGKKAAAEEQMLGPARYPSIPEAASRPPSLDKITIAGISLTSVAAAAGVGSAIAIPFYHPHDGDRVSPQNVAFWSFVSAGLLGTGTVIYSLTRKSKTVSLAASYHGAGVTIAGQW